jgi:hypothetical protein
MIEIEEKEKLTTIMMKHENWQCFECMQVKMTCVI